MQCPNPSCYETIYIGWQVCPKCRTPVAGLPEIENLSNDLSNRIDNLETASEQRLTKIKTMMSKIVDVAFNMVDPDSTPEEIKNELFNL